jgi:5-formyltetrahydrofolate cyclo-ligase
MTKSEWRKKMKQQLVLMEKEERREKSQQIANYLFQTKQWKSCKSMGITVSRNFELDTSLIIEAAWNNGITVCVPKCYSKDKQMEFRAIQSYDQLENVYMDLYEPIVDQTNVILSEDIDLLIVPGLVFDRSGYRIGYGGGYYDRYLAGYSGTTISLAYQSQLMDLLPHEKFDVPVEQVITEIGSEK